MIEKLPLSTLNVVKKSSINASASSSSSRRSESKSVDGVSSFFLVRLAFENLKATLTAAGCTFDDIVDVTTFHTDPEQQLNDVMAVKQEIFAYPPYPNWTAVGVTWLAGFDFEIKVIARIP